MRTGGWTYGFSRTTGALASLTRNGRNLLCEPQAIDVFRVPVGGELEYTDEVTLMRAFQGRTEL